MGGRATRVIARRSILRPPGMLGLLAAVAAACGAFLAGTDAAVLLGAAGVIAAAVSCVQRAGVGEMTNLRYFAAPLYGREMARALAIAPCVHVVAYGLLFAAVAAGALGALRTVPDDAAPRLVVLLGAQVIATIVALSAAFRAGRERWLYVALAIIAGTAVEVVGAAATPVALGAAAIAAATIGFLALRALGETLARYDPIDDL